VAQRLAVVLWHHAVGVATLIRLMLIGVVAAVVSWWQLVEQQTPTLKVLFFINRIPLHQVVILS
jgi:hypothetical protein